MKEPSKTSRYWRLRTTLLMLLLLVAVGGWLYQQSGFATANNWSWEDQLEMEAAMKLAAREASAAVPEIDRAIPETETALFALG